MLLGCVLPDVLVGCLEATVILLELCMIDGIIRDLDLNLEARTAIAMSASLRTSYFDSCTPTTTRSKSPPSASMASDSSSLLGRAFPMFHVKTHTLMGGAAGDGEAFKSARLDGGSEPRGLAFMKAAAFESLPQLVIPSGGRAGCEICAAGAALGKS